SAPEAAHPEHRLLQPVGERRLERSVLHEVTGRNGHPARPARERLVLRRHPCLVPEKRHELCPFADIQTSDRPLPPASRAAGTPPPLSAPTRRALRASRRAS